MPVPDEISQCKGRILIVKAMKRIRSRAVIDIIVAWLMLRRSFPRSLSPLVMRSLDNVSFIPNLSHLVLQLNGVFYLILRLILPY